jgi:hypothetical protein
MRRVIWRLLDESILIYYTKLCTTHDPKDDESVIVLAIVGAAALKPCSQWTTELNDPTGHSQVLTKGIGLHLELTDHLSRSVNKPRGMHVLNKKPYHLGRRIKIL